MGFGYQLPHDRVEWTILTIGRVSRNKFWGEMERVREPLCTCTLLHCSAGMMLVDPSLPPERMGELLSNQAGLRVEDIQHIFLTHFHHDHRSGLAAFPEAQWWMAGAEIDWWRSQANPDELELLKRIKPVGAELVPGFRVLPTPGHTAGHASLLFEWRGKRVAVAGDAVMAEEYFRARDVHVKSFDFTQARASLDLLSGEADLIIPGHDIPLVVTWAQGA